MGYGSSCPPLCRLPLRDCRCLIAAMIGSCSSSCQPMWVGRDSIGHHNVVRDDVVEAPSRVKVKLPSRNPKPGRLTILCWLIAGFAVQDCSPNDTSHRLQTDGDGPSPWMRPRVRLQYRSRPRATKGSKNGVTRLELCMQHHACAHCSRSVENRVFHRFFA